MAASVSLRAYPEPIRSLGFASISGSYMGIGTGLTWPSRILMFQNATDADVFISWDGINDHQYVPSHSFTLLDLTANKLKEDGWYVTSGQRFYVKESAGAPTVGSVYLTTFFGLSEGG